MPQRLLLLCEALKRNIGVLFREAPKQDQRRSRDLDKTCTFLSLFFRQLIAIRAGDELKYRFLLGNEVDFHIFPSMTIAR